MELRRNFVGEFYYIQEREKRTIEEQPRKFRITTVSEALDYLKELKERENGMIKVEGKLIKMFEGFSQYPYKCPAGYWTIGYGSRYYPNGKPVTADDNSINEKVASDILKGYLKKYVVPTLEKMPYEMSQSQIEALASLIYNIGSQAFLKSKLYKAIVKGDNEAIFKEWNWIRASNIVLKGLIKRRVAELHYWFNGNMF